MVYFVSDDLHSRLARHITRHSARRYDMGLVEWADQYKSLLELATEMHDEIERLHRKLEEVAGEPTVGSP